MATKGFNRKTAFLLILILGGNYFLLSKSKKITHAENKLLTEIASIREIIQENNVQASSCENELANINLQLGASEEILRLLHLAGEEKEIYLRELENELSAIEIEIEKTRAVCVNLFLEHQQNLKTESKILFLFSSRNTNQFLTRLWYLEELKKHKLNYLKKLLVKKTEVVKKRALYTNASNERILLAKAHREEVENLKQLKESQLRTKNLLSAENELLLKKINKRKKELADLNSLVAESITSFEKKTTPTNISQKFKIHWPLKKGLIISKFGKHSHPDFQGIHIQNNGIDILTTNEEPVKCALNGEISAIVEIPNLNTTIIVKSGDYRLVYSNVKNVQVVVGGEVNAGQELGLVATDAEGRPTLHFEVWNHSNKMDPEQLK